MNRLNIFLVVVLLLSGCSEESALDTKKNTPQDLIAHSETFKKGVVRVTDKVYVAIGYGLANSIMIEGHNGLIIVDTMETVEEGQEVLAAFREITEKPVRALIYTHNHADHVFGSAAFVSEGNGDTPVDVYAHETTQYYINRVVNKIRPVIAARSMRMFGSHLNQEELVNAGIGPYLGVEKSSVLHAISPTHTFKDRLKMTIEGIDIELVHAPGETEDQLFVWLPRQKVLMPGDNIYKAFPNLYTIRGTYYRDVNKWINSLDKMRRLQAEFVVPGHTRPIVGKQNVAETLQVYRDAIQFVHDQTVRLMNKGLTPDEIVHQVHLPDHLATHPYLLEFYGTVAWSVRSVFNGYLGWFDGNSTTLNPISPQETSKRIIRMVGGSGELLAQLNEAVQVQDLTWALKIADTLMYSDKRGEARAIKAQVLRKLAAMESNPNARHYYFTEAMELEDDDFTPAIYPKPQPEFIAQLPVDNVFRTMPVALKAEDTLDVELTVQFNLTDIDQIYSIQIRRGIAEVQNHALGEPDVVITTTAKVWKEVAANIRNPLGAIVSGDLKVSEGKLALVEFLGYFDLPEYD